MAETPWWQPRAEKFQHTFAKYFPHLDDFDVAANEWSWLHSHWLCNQIRTARPSQTRKELSDVVRALRLIAKCDPQSAWGKSIYDAMGAAKAGSADQITKDHAFIAEAIMNLQNMDEDGALEAALTRFQNAANDAISKLPDTGNTKWDAVFAVEALRSVWWRNTGRDAPVKALNPASEFASYLRDGFDYLKVDANPVAAFRRWVAWQRAIAHP